MTVTARDIEAAAGVLAGQVVRSTLSPATRLGEMLDCTLFFKMENQQFTGSFKDRGACHKIWQLRQAGGDVRGVIAASAGNHAQGVARHAQRNGLPATIVMPLHTPFAKVERTQAMAANVVLHGESLLEAYDHARELATQRGLTFVHPYDDEHIIAGQGTIAIEMFEDQPDLDLLVVPIGGGGLISGIATWTRERRPNVRIVGVQTTHCPAMFDAVRGQQSNLRTDTIADGIAVKKPGGLTLPIVQTMVDDIVLADEGALERAVQALVNVQKTVAEGAGAAALAAMLVNPGLVRGRRVGAVLSGGNIDARLLSTVLLRGLQRDGKIARVRIEIRDVPGVLAQVTALIGATGADIIEIEHQRLFSTLPPRRAELDVVMEAHGKAHVERILTDLQRAGFTARTL